MDNVLNFGVVAGDTASLGPANQAALEALVNTVIAAGGGTGGLSGWHLPFPHQGSAEQVQSCDSRRPRPDCGSWATEKPAASSGTGTRALVVMRISSGSRTGSANVCWSTCTSSRAF